MSYYDGTITLSAELIAETGSSLPVTTSKPVVAPAAVPAVAKFSVQSVDPPKNDAASTYDSPGWIGVSTKHSAAGGAVITGVTADGPGARAGLKTGDLINSVNGIPLRDEDFDAKIALCKSGSKVRIGYLR